MSFHFQECSGGFRIGQNRHLAVRRRLADRRSVVRSVKTFFDDARLLAELLFL